MTVKELKEKLDQFPEDLPVVVTYQYDILDMEDVSKGWLQKRHGGYIPLSYHAGVINPNGVQAVVFLGPSEDRG